MEFFVDDVYTVERYMITYYGIMYHILDSLFWKKRDLFLLKLFVIDFKRSGRSEFIRKGGPSVDNMGIF